MPLNIKNWIIVQEHLPYKTESLGEHEAMGTSDMGIGNGKLAQAMNYAMMRAKRGC
jgi:hypothetical protein